MEYDFVIHNYSLYGSLVIIEGLSLVEVIVSVIYIAWLFQ